MLTKKRLKQNIGTVTLVLMMGLPGTAEKAFADVECGGQYSSFRAASGIETPEECKEQARQEAENTSSAGFGPGPATNEDEANARGNSNNSVGFGPGPAPDTENNNEITVEEAERRASEIGRLDPGQSCPKYHKRLNSYCVRANSHPDVADDRGQRDKGSFDSSVDCSSQFSVFGRSTGKDLSENCREKAERQARNSTGAGFGPGPATSGDDTGSENGTGDNAAGFGPGPAGSNESPVVNDPSVTQAVSAGGFDSPGGSGGNDGVTSGGLGSVASDVAGGSGGFGNTVNSAMNGQNGISPHNINDTAGQVAEQAKGGLAKFQDMRKITGKLASACALGSCLKEVNLENTAKNAATGIAKGAAMDAVNNQLNKRFNIDASQLTSASLDMQGMQSLAGGLPGGLDMGGQLGDLGGQLGDIGGSLGDIGGSLGGGGFGI